MLDIFSNLLPITYLLPFILFCFCVDQISKTRGKLKSNSLFGMHKLGPILIQNYSKSTEALKVNQRSSFMSVTGENYFAIEHKLFHMDVPQCNLKK